MRIVLGRSGVPTHCASPPCWRAIWRTSVRPRPAPELSAVRAAGDAEERREHALALAGSDAGAAVADGDRWRCAPSRAHLDLDRRRAVALGVLDQVAHHAAQQARGRRSTMTGSPATVHCS